MVCKNNSEQPAPGSAPDCSPSDVVTNPSSAAEDVDDISAPPEIVHAYAAAGPGPTAEALSRRAVGEGSVRSNDPPSVDRRGKVAAQQQIPTDAAAADVAADEDGGEEGGDEEWFLVSG